MHVHNWRAVFENLTVSKRIFYSYGGQYVIGVLKRNIVAKQLIQAQSFGRCTKNNQFFVCTSVLFDGLLKPVDVQIKFGV